MFGKSIVLFFCFCLKIVDIYDITACKTSQEHDKLNCWVQTYYCKKESLDGFPFSQTPVMLKPNLTMATSSISPVVLSIGALTFRAQSPFLLLKQNSSQHFIARVPLFIIVNS